MKNFKNIYVLDMGFAKLIFKIKKYDLGHIVL